VPFLRFLPLPTPFRVSLPRCGAVLFECLGGWIRVGGCAGSAGFTTIIKPVVSAPEPMTSKTTGAVMADVWSMPNPEAEPTPPPSPTPTPPASLHGDAADDVKPLPTPSQRIRNAAVEATVAAAAPPVPPATTNGFSDAFYTACNENVAEARDMAIKAAKQVGYFPGGCLPGGEAGAGRAQCEQDATVADAAADIYTDLAATAALAACVTRASAVAGAYTTTVTYQYDLVAEKVKRDIQAEYQEASDMRAEFVSDFPLPPKF